jgi:hypothetical protein
MEGNGREFEEEGDISDYGKRYKSRKITPVLSLQGS